jgi:hypothetical protein
MHNLIQLHFKHIAIFHNLFLNRKTDKKIADHKINNCISFTYTFRSLVYKFSHATVSNGEDHAFIIVALLNAMKKLKYAGFVSAINPA